MFTYFQFLSRSNADAATLLWRENVSETPHAPQTCAPSVHVSITNNFIVLLKCEIQIQTIQRIIIIK